MSNTNATAIVTNWARKDYLDLFPTADEAVEFENQSLSIGRALLPVAALAVLDGGEATSDYYAWLADQKDAAQHKRSWQEVCDEALKAPECEDPFERVAAQVRGRSASQ